MDVGRHYALPSLIYHAVILDERCPAALQRRFV